MAIEVTTAVAPEYWACYLINGDSSYLEDDELIAIDRWLDAQAPYYVVACDDDKGFMWRHDGFAFWPFGAECVTYTLHKIADDRPDPGESWAAYYARKNID